jgi:hypothetical protein
MDGAKGLAFLNRRNKLLTLSLSVWVHTRKVKMRFKKYILAAELGLCILLLAGLARAQNDTTRVLFIGNSHTYFNNLPHMFAFLAESGGYPVAADSNTPPGYTLEGHCSNITTLAKINRGGWDYVILQENSLYTVIDFYRYGSMYPSAIRLDSMITANRCRTALFMTWGWRGGGQRDLNGHYSAPFADYFEMQDTMTVTYARLADSLSAVLVPAGCAWARAMHTDTTLDLWNSTDNYHPNPMGSYLAACVFYAVFFHQSPIGLSYTAGLSPDTAAFLQTMADQTVGINDERPAPIPRSFQSLQNYPNPFNPSTTISYDLSEPAFINLDIYTILGRKIATLAEGIEQAGIHQVIWNAGGLPSGIYFARLRTDSRSQTIKMVLTK